MVIQQLVHLVLPDPDHKFQRSALT